MQTQTQTQRVRAKETKKLIYTGCSAAAVVAVIAYVICTVYFKFFMVDEKTMGTLFYSWRVEGADESALKEKMDKFNVVKGQEDMKELMESYIKDSYPIHLPRFIANHLTFAYPNIDLFLGFRKSIVSAEAKANEAKFSKDVIGKYNKIVNQVMFYNPDNWEGTDLLKETFDKHFDGLKNTEQKELMKSVTIKMIDFVENMFSNSSFAYDGVNPSEKAVDGLADIIYTIIKSGHIGDDKFNQYLDDNEDSDRFLKKNGLYEIEDKKEFSRTLSEKFFTQATSGVLYPYFSYGYSTMLNTIVYLCLDLKGLEYNSSFDLEVDENIKPLAEIQQKGSSKISAIGSAVAYGMAKNLSPTEEVGTDTVKSQRNPIVFTLFTSKLANSAENDKENLAKILKHIKSKKDLIKSL
ncbi:hypothetical protein NERG_01077 [Nematocida ausubeli]|uniref:Uncharacterized protein n=1 Tax=Nematocida ausubeli (strain ATCC PRA-371 / ERTm2) TaxID=1913371 RepID=H8ZCT0_NEMA1|nr:hypothetical protein NERG_01077 [Nematocida ausubeli]